MSGGLLTLLMFASMIFLLALGLPLAFTLAGIALGFTLWLWGPAGLFIISAKATASLRTIILVAVPLFVFMAAVLERSGIGEDLYGAMHRWMGGLRGGLSMGTVLICTLFAAMTGISSASTVTMGLVALPPMLERRYNKSIALGCIMAGGALGILIPPSVVMIVFGLFAGVSVGKLFAAGIFPGLLLASLFITYISVRCVLNPALGPPLSREERANWAEKLASLRGVILPMLLVLAVLGSIFAGLATPTEAAAVGALGSLVCAAVHRTLSWRVLKEACLRTLTITCMVMWIILASNLFVAVYQGLGASKLITDLLLALPVNRWVILVAMQATYFILGCFVDPIGMLMITIPIFLPVIKALGFDVLWFGVLYVMNSEMAYLTPPFGTNLFYLKGVAPKEITMAHIYRAIVPFVLLQGLGLVIVMVIPQIAMWLPGLIFK